MLGYVLEIILQSYGRIPDEAKGEIRELMEDCFRKLSPPSPEIVDVILFEDSSRMEGYLLAEQNSVGVYSQGLDAKFVATHEAWTGIPRILVCYERLQELSPQLRRAVVRHEAAHSILHGSPEYYIFPIPRPLLKASEKYDLPRDYTLHILYLLAMGVKDYEATRILLDHGYVEDQIEYAWHFCKTGIDDLEAWKISKGDPKKELLCLAGRFKDFACVTAVMTHHGSNVVELAAAKKELEYLPEDTGSRLLEVCAALAQMNGHDTFSKVELAAELIAGRLIPPIFEG